MTMNAYTISMELRNARSAISVAINDELKRLAARGLIVEQLTLDFATNHKMPSGDAVNSVLTNVGLRVFDTDSKLSIEI